MVDYVYNMSMSIWIQSDITVLLLRTVYMLGFVTGHNSVKLCVSVCSCVTQDGCTRRWSQEPKVLLSNWKNAGLSWLTTLWTTTSLPSAMHLRWALWFWTACALWSNLRRKSLKRQASMMWSRYDVTEYDIIKSIIWNYKLCCLSK